MSQLLRPQPEPTDCTSTRDMPVANSNSPSCQQQTDMSTRRTVQDAETDWTGYVMQSINTLTSEDGRPETASKLSIKEQSPAVCSLGAYLFEACKAGPES